MTIDYQCTINTRLALVDFALRHFDPTFIGTKVRMSPDHFLQTLSTKRGVMRPGTAPFVKELVVPNFAKCLMGKARITKQNEHLLQTGDITRRDGEKSFSAMWFNAADVEPEQATYLHIILYSRDQLQKEGVQLDDGVECGIVSINAEADWDAAPPTPETIRRNREGIDAGGNGYQHTDEELMESTRYHSTWANVQ